MLKSESEQVITTTFNETAEQLIATTSEVSFDNTTEQIVTEAFATEAFVAIDEGLFRLYRMAYI